MAMSAQVQTVLALNCGSSSLKFGLFRVDGTATALLLDGEAESIGGAEGRFSARAMGQIHISEDGPIASHIAAVRRLTALLAELKMPAPTAIGHRIVHGGPSIRRHCLINTEILQTLEAAQVFAPLHSPAALAVVRLAQAHFTQQPHFACLDTAFHRDLPDVARRFPIAAALGAKGVQRYGFHGLSCESIVRQLGEPAPDRLVIAHLGSGSSITAVKSGRSIDTSMGLTPSGGVMMATRAGDLDPGLLIYLIRERGLDASSLEVMIDRESGMAGVSGVSGDVRRLREAGEGADAQLAIQMFVYSVRKQIAAMAAVLEGLDMLVFTGGIGEKDLQTRTEIRSGLGWLGVPPEPQAEEGPAVGSMSPRPSVSIAVFPANEEEQVARIVGVLAGADR